MDYTIANNAKLFDELLGALAKHAEDPGITEAIAHLRAAKENYVQRSLDHMLNSLVLALYDLSTHRIDQRLSDELNSVISSFVHGIIEAPARLRKMAEEYERRGGKLLSADEILREVEERRGLSG
jgi:hypothetical protein